MPFLLPTLGKIIIGAAGLATMTVLAAREFRRLSEEARMKPVRTQDGIQNLPKLRRDPKTGEYRPM